MLVRGVNRRASSGIEMNEKLLSDLSEKLAAMAGGRPRRRGCGRCGCRRRSWREDSVGPERERRPDRTATQEEYDEGSYDVQAQVLARAREKLEALERRVAELERARAAPGTN